MTALGNQSNPLASIPQTTSKAEDGKRVEVLQMDGH